MRVAQNTSAGGGLRIFGLKSISVNYEEAEKCGSPKSYFVRLFKK
jgi:hypothetical protein